ncbi:MAG TPA: cytochrome c peroxidase [Nannocystaceae bacterium]|nr:cytochrome c peroxidase [Nannocystaceae bacterium]
MHIPLRTRRPPRSFRTASAALMAAALVLACDKGGGELPVHKGKPHAQRDATPASSDFENGGAPSKPKETISPAALIDRARPLIQALPPQADNPANPLTDAKIELGRMLYFDPRLSKGQGLSCNTCHVLTHYGIDTREQSGARSKTSEGHRKQFGERNTPTVYNAAFALAQFWDGRAADVEQQAGMPIVNPVEMAMANPEGVVAVIKSIPGYAPLFQAAFPDASDPLTYENIGKAIGAFERKLVTPAAFDKFMKGDTSALDEDQMRGLKLFLDVGCTQCHTGPAIGGTQFQKLGSVKPWPNLVDTGREKHTGAAADRYFFKVPTLRNVAETGPWLHDGSIGTLEKMVELMSEHQTSRGKLSAEETRLLVAFLGALTGELPREYIAEPKLPENGPTTPAPDPS